MKKECVFMKVLSATSKTGRPYYVATFCDDEGDNFRVFINEEMFKKLSTLAPLSRVVLELDINVFRQNLNVLLKDVIY